MVLFDLFTTFLLLGAFSFGGGIGSMELIRSRVVTMRGWMTNAEFTDIISISEMTPGPLGINIASFVGARTAGIPGTIVATFSYVLPAIFIVMIMARIFFRCRNLKGVQGVLKGLRPAIAAMVLAAAVSLSGTAWWNGISNISLKNTNWIAIAISGVMLVLLGKKKLGPIMTILASGVIGAVIYALLGIPSSSHLQLR